MSKVPDAWWSLPAGELMSALGSGTGGLTRRQAAARLAAGGPNRLTDPDAPSPLWLLLRQFESPLVLILVAAACVSLLVREWAEAGIVLVIVGASTLLGFTQEYRAAVSVAALRSRLALTVDVLRNGMRMTIPAEAVVPGDVVLLSAGNLIPADGVVLAARDFLVTQAALTGESLPVEKMVGICPPEAPLCDRINAVFQGASVRSGTARVLAVRTGRATVFAGIAGRLAQKQPETDFARGIRRFGILLTRVMTVVVVVVLAASMALDRPAIDSLLFSVALAVGLTPELLPAIVSVTMANGARRLARHGAIVRRAEAMENLGAIDVLCTDKTGTLTTGALTLTRASDPEGDPSDAVFVLAQVNAALETGIANPLDAAILAAAEARGLQPAAPAKVDEIPYDFLRRRLSIVIDLGNDHRRQMITKGACAEVLACCSHVAGGAGDLPLDPDTRARVEAMAAAWGAQGERVLAIATRMVGPRTNYDVADERGMTLAGFVAFADPLKPGIDETLVRLGGLGITTRIITGDTRHVARGVAHAVGLPDTVLTGADLARTRDEALWHLAETTHVFAEVDPQQKERIVRALQRRGHVVAFLGDGINDVPALSAADVGISVDQAVDVARESADIVLVARDLDILAEGVVEGRRTFANTLKYVAITTSANFGNMISMAIGTVFLPFLPMTPAQILLNNLLSDIPALSIAGDLVDPEAVAAPPRWDMAAIRRFMLVFGLLSTAFDLLAFGILFLLLDADEGLFQTVWFQISLLTELAVLLVLRTARPVKASRPRTVLAGLSAAVACVAVALPWISGPAATVLGFVAPPVAVTSAAAMIVLAYVVATEAVKRSRLGQGRAPAAGGVASRRR